jgi:hypothetical protein
VLEQTPGVDSARVITDAEQRALLEPWFGPDLPVEDLPVPRLIEITETPDGYDATACGSACRRGARGRAGRSHALARTAGRGGRASAPAGLGVACPDRGRHGGDDHAGRAGRVVGQCAR